MNHCPQKAYDCLREILSYICAPAELQNALDTAAQAYLDLVAEEHTRAVAELTDTTDEPTETIELR